MRIKLKKTSCESDRILSFSISEQIFRSLTVLRFHNFSASPYEEEAWRDLQERLRGCNLPLGKVIKYYYVCWGWPRQSCSIPHFRERSEICTQRISPPFTELLPSFSWWWDSTFFFRKIPSYFWEEPLFLISGQRPLEFIAFLNVSGECKSSFSFYFSETKKAFGRIFSLEMHASRLCANLSDLLSGRGREERKSFVWIWNPCFSYDADTTYKFFEIRYFW